MLSGEGRAVRARPQVNVSYQE